MSLVTTRVAMATDAIWLTVYRFVSRPVFFLSWSHVLYNRAVCRSHMWVFFFFFLSVCFLPWKRPPCLMTMAPRLRVSSSACAMLWRALSYESSVALTVIFFWITPRHDSSSAALGGGRRSSWRQRSDRAFRIPSICYLFQMSVCLLCWCFSVQLDVCLNQPRDFAAKHTTPICSLTLCLPCVILANSSAACFRICVWTQAADVMNNSSTFSQLLAFIRITSLARSHYFQASWSRAVRTPWVLTGI